MQCRKLSFFDENLQVDNPSSYPLLPWSSTVMYMYLYLLCLDGHIPFSKGMQFYFLEIRTEYHKKSLLKFVIHIIYIIF